MRTSTMLTPIRCTSRPRTLSSFIPRRFSATFSQPKSQSFISIKKPSFPGNPVSIKRQRYLCMSLSSRSEDGSQKSSIQGGEAFFRGVLESMQSVYLGRNPTAKAILDLVESADNSQICYDHLAFRTFGVNGYGIDSMASFFLDYGYTPQEELRFPAKKLKALWFSPPRNSFPGGGSGIHGPLPRIFISELLVDQMSPQTQEIIRKYTGSSGNGNKYAAIAGSLGILTWEKPLYSEFQQLASESEYAAWTLVNGHALNHVTISTHRLKSHLRNIKNLNQFIEDSNIRLNSEGGILKGLELELEEPYDQYVEHDFQTYELNNCHHNLE